jgi:hypothetical protein
VPTCAVQDLPQHHLGRLRPARRPGQSSSPRRVLVPGPPRANQKQLATTDPQPLESVERNHMNLDRAVLAFAGTMTLPSAVLAATVSPWWLLLTAFIGLNQIQASITGFCPAAMAFNRLGIRPGCAFDGPRQGRNPAHG